MFEAKVGAIFALEKVPTDRVDPLRRRQTPRTPPHSLETTNKGPLANDRYKRQQFRALQIPRMSGDC